MLKFRWFPRGFRKFFDTVIFRHVKSTKHKNKLDSLFLLSTPDLNYFLQLLLKKILNGYSKINR